MLDPETLIILVHYTIGSSLIYLSLVHVLEAYEVSKMVRLSYNLPGKIHMGDTVVVFQVHRQDE